MSDTKMLQAIINNQVEIKKSIVNLESNLKKEIKRVEKKVDKNGQRIDSLGKNLAYLEDDAPTRKEYKNHEKRLTKLENKVFA